MVGIFSRRQLLCGCLAAHLAAPFSGRAWRRLSATAGGLGDQVAGQEPRFEGGWPELYPERVLFPLLSLPTFQHASELPLVPSCIVGSGVSLEKLSSTFLSCCFSG